MAELTMTIPEVAKQLNISLPTAYELAKSDGFPSLRIGARRIVVPVEAFKQWIDKNVGQRSR